ncbi:MAG: 16S rRNA (guanine(527)-N(7))-methyltransferase RsmG [Pyrinomonadaceae bacterium]
MSALKENMVASHADKFTQALETQATLYEVQLNAGVTASLRDYYERVNIWNARLHLVAPCSPAEFATRHVLESLMLLPHLSHGARVVDVGSGAGLPIIPCLIARPDIKATLIEASPKKAIFLREALHAIDRQNEATVIAERFECIAPPPADFITCRALDRFIELFPKIIRWSSARTLLLFGGGTLEEQIAKNSLAYATIHIPNSERRSLFVVQDLTKA